MTLDSIKQKTQQLFQEVLVDGSLGIDEDFLGAGGDSISAMLLISRIHSLFGVEVPLEDFFLDQANVATISTVIHESLQKRSS